MRIEGRAILGWPVHLVEIDALDTEAFERGVHLAADTRGQSDLTGRRLTVVLIPDEAALGEDIRAFAYGDLRKRLAHNLRVTDTVDRCRVDPVDAARHGMTNGCDRGLIVLCAPADGPSLDHQSPRRRSRRG
jgi:hypothetical protein